MKNGGSSLSTNLGLLMARAPLGAFFAIVGFGLIMDGVGDFVIRNASLVPVVVPEQVARGLLWALPFATVLVGMMIIFGVFTRTAGLLAAVILASIMFLVTGVFAAPPEPFHISVVLLGVAILVFLVGGGGLSLDHMFLSKPRKPAGAPKE
jgi:uncharacterized membrane protein YphA (DoxX/SURF4 family)